MRIFILSNLILFAAMLNSQIDERQALIKQERFGHAWKLPEEFTEQRLQKLIGDMVNEIYGVGFRYIGVEEDFFHGHVLFTADKLTKQGRMMPFAILYHTQEEAKAAHWSERVDKKYDYLDVQTRNWLQWLDGEHDESPVENARVYVDAKEKDPSLFYEVTEPIKGQAFTIHPHNLDISKLGYDVVGDMQFEFYRYDCNEEFKGDLYTRGPIQVTFPGGEVECLKLRTMTVFKDWAEWGF